MSNSPTKSRYYRILLNKRLTLWCYVCLLGISVALVLNQSYKWFQVYSPTSQSTIALYEDLLLLLLISCLCIFPLVGLTFDRRRFPRLSEWSEPFFHSGAVIRLIATGFYFPLIVYAIFCALMFEAGSGMHLMGLAEFSAVWIAVYGVIVASGVYLEVSSAKTVTLTEFMETAIRVLEDTSTDSEVVIVAPSLCVGTLEPSHAPLARKFRDAVIEALKHAKANGKLLCLGFEKVGTKPTTLEAYQSAYLESCKNQDAYKWLHHFYTDKTNKGESTPPQWFKEVVDFHDDLAATNALIAANTAGNDALFKDARNRGFFAVCNLTRGQYYFGSYDVASYDGQSFEGTRFEERGINAQMAQMLKQLIEANKKP